ncbi:MAG: nucleotidyltransferase family protein [Gammaproteobacteria bacterium]|nr:nucleotidyltransferase family protein [Gammaproteobacteria bacterium]
MSQVEDQDVGAALRVGGIVLAAGRGRRFGSDKREARLSDGTGMLERSAGLLAAVCDELLVVIGEDDHEQDYRGRFGAARVLRSPRSDGGMGYSLADAVAQSLHWDACLVMLADKPFVAPATMARVRELLDEHQLVVPTFGQAWGHPVGFARQHFFALTRLEGEAGARTLIAAERDQYLFLELDDPGVIADVDTPQQLDYWSGLLER